MSREREAGAGRREHAGTRTLMAIDASAGPVRNAISDPGLRARSGEAA